jgi:hypothetical protein
MTARDKQLEADDPYELVAVQVPGPPGYDGPAEMARVFIEEFALMGWPPERILRLFRSRAFAGTHAVYEERGEAFVWALIEAVFGRRAVAAAPGPGHPEGGAGHAEGA